MFKTSQTKIFYEYIYFYFVHKRMYAYIYFDSIIKFIILFLYHNRFTRGFVH